VAEEFIAERRRLAVWKKWEAGERPIVASGEDIKELLAFCEAQGSLELLIRTCTTIMIYGVPVVDSEGKPWLWRSMPVC